MAKKLMKFLEQETTNLRDAGLFRDELVITSAQNAEVSADRKLVNLSSSNYLGWASNAAIKKAAKQSIDRFGTSPAAPRLLTGTQPPHLELEQAVSDFLGTEATLLYSSGYHANTGLFEALFSDRDYVFCDDWVHPSIADGIRLSRAHVLPFRNNDLDHLEDRLKRSRLARFRAVVTDGVFALDGTSAQLGRICDLADTYDALVVVDDAHGIGVCGTTGRGSPEQQGVVERVDLVTGTFAHAFGVAGAGYVSGRRRIIDWLRQKSRPYLAVTGAAPAAVGAAQQALQMFRDDPAPLQALRDNTGLFRTALKKAGLELEEAEHPIVAVRVGDAVTAQRMADGLYRKGIFATGFCHPVVPEGEARIRAQVSAAHSKRALQETAKVFASLADKLGLY